MASTSTTQFTGYTAVPMPGRNTNAFVADLVDREPARYWDTVQTLTGGSQVCQPVYFCFSGYIGSQNQFLPGNAANTKLQTNMQKANEFPAPRCLLLNAICFQYSSRMTFADIQLFEDSAYMEFKISEKIFHEGYIRDFPAGAGISGFSTNSGVDIVNNGIPAPNYERMFGSWSKYIPPLTRFSLNIILNGSNNLGAGGTAAPPTMTGPAGLYMRILLDGVSDLPVQ
jgi:hypothetical protein